MSKLVKKASSRNRWLALGLVGFGLICGIYPAYVVIKSPQYSLQDDPLKRQLQIRGQYMNSGSKDVGRDKKYQLQFCFFF